MNTKEEKKGVTIFLLVSLYLSGGIAVQGFATLNSGFQVSPNERAWTILGSALLPSRNSSSVSLSSLFLSIWLKILSTRRCGVFSSSEFGVWP